MSIRLIRQKEDAILRKKSKVVTEMTDNIKNLIIDMKETMKEKSGCGLAAVQVGILKNIIICAPEEDGEIVVLINPQIVSESKEQVEAYEGCLSIEGYRARVYRPKNIVVKALNEEMKEIEFDASGFFARIICHEIDHLNGILYFDRAVEGSFEKEATDDEDEE